jgi:hypothetical protein
LDRYALDSIPEGRKRFSAKLEQGEGKMKKMLAGGLLVLAALAVLGTGVAAAQSPQPPTPVPGGGNGRGFGPMWFGSENGAYGPMHEYMTNALAEALGISPDEFESRREAGETAYQIAVDLGFSADQIPTLLRDARVKALDAAATANVITQEQADWMKSRGAGMGFGNCGGTGGMMGFGMGRGWRFQQGNP